MTYARTHRPISMQEYSDSMGKDTMRELVSGYGEDLLEVLEQQRDPWLLFAVIHGLNYDLESSFEVAAWVLEQPDCDEFIAISAFGLMQGSFWCGQAESYKDVDRPLVIISERAECAPFQKSVMSPRGVEHANGLAQKAKLFVTQIQKYIMKLDV